MDEQKMNSYLLLKFNHLSSFASWIISWGT